MAVALLAALACPSGGVAMLAACVGREAVDTTSTREAPDLTAVRAKVKAKEWKAAIADLNGMIDKGVQHADVYNLLGFSLRKSGDLETAYTFYRKALDFDPEHKGALEYLGELYVETGELAKAREHVVLLHEAVPAGCEELEDLREGDCRGRRAPRPTEHSGIRHASDMRNETAAAAAALVGRLLLAALFLLEGWSKLRGYGAGRRLHGAVLGARGCCCRPVILSSWAAALLLAVGWQTRCAALALRDLLRRRGAAVPHQLRRPQPAAPLREGPRHRRRAAGARSPSAPGGYSVDAMRQS